MVGRENYGYQRLWASVSWGITAFIVGTVVDKLSVYAIFVAFTVTSLALACLLAIRAKAFPLEFQPLHKTALPFWQAIRQLLSSWDIIVVLLSAFMTGFCLSTVAFLFYYLRENFNVGKSLFGLYGLSICCSVSMEIPLFFFSKKLFAWLGEFPMLMISQVCFIARVSLYTVIPDPYLILPLELLHGIVFAPVWTAGVTLIAKNAPPEIAATGQGVFQAVYSGLGTGIGQIVCGFVVARLGCIFLYRGAAVLMGVFLAFSIINYIAVTATRRWRRQAPGTPSEPQLTGTVDEMEMALVHPPPQVEEEAAAGSGNVEDNNDASANTTNHSAATT
eukprot:TRINITY_DN2541_c0_g1_i1.p1 TRINITY_DN2541_c0_g1~~TRINITY_DN2541_c0_g1_i1.p1  ORF type:complete len:333 (-),score=69.93 TRINITY_DN2541_c0_g1_i1:64-1062(-)